MSSGSSAERLRASGRLGLTLRSILLAPADGFDAALRAADRRGGSHGKAPYVLGAIGGAAAMVLWLKFAALAGTRDVASAAFGWDLFVGALALGAVVAVAAELLWGALGKLLAAMVGGDTSARNLRIVWGAAAFPQVFALALLVPLDILIVGTDSFTSEKITDPLSTLWAALSVALGVSLAVWSMYLFVRGTAVATRLSFGRATVASVGGLLSAGIVLIALMAIASAVTG